MSRRTRSVLLTLMAGCVVATILFGQAACGPGTDSPSRSGSPTTADDTVTTPPRDIPAGCVPAANAPRDPKTGLPTRIVHEGSGVVFVLVPAGELVMGGAEPGERRKRVIREPFYLGETEVTVGQFRRFAEQAGYRSDAERGVPEGDGSGGDGTVGGFSELPDGKGQQRKWHPGSNWRNPLPNFADVVGEPRLSSDWPVVQVSWHDATRFAAHFGFRLPSEVQWEYACRAGSTKIYPWGEAAAGAGHANVGDASFRRLMGIPEGGFPFDDRAATLAKVASYQPNAWGLYDMIGNVDEWCEDESRWPIPSDLTDESAVVASGRGPHHRVIRGGSWLGAGGGSSERHACVAEGRREWIGFRVAAATRRVADR